MSVPQAASDLLAHSARTTLGHPLPIAMVPPNLRGEAGPVKPPNSVLSSYGTTVFEVMSRLAIEHGIAAPVNAALASLVRHMSTRKAARVG